MKVYAIINRPGGFEFILGIFGCRFLFDSVIILFFDFVKLFEVVFLRLVVVIVLFPCPLILFF